MISFDEFKADGRLPVYQQILDYIKRGAVAGTIADGDELPSRRVLSARLGINPNTIQRAYRMMEDEGLTVSIPGKGNFVTEDTDALQQDHRAKQCETVRRELAALKKLGGTKSDVLQLVDEVYGG